MHACRNNFKLVKTLSRTFLSDGSGMAQTDMMKKKLCSHSSGAFERRDPIRRLLNFHMFSVWNSAILQQWAGFKWNRSPHNLLLFMNMFLELVHFWHHVYHYDRWQYMSNIKRYHALIFAPQDSKKAPKTTLCNKSYMNNWHLRVDNGLQCLHVHGCSNKQVPTPCLWASRIYVPHSLGFQIP